MNDEIECKVRIEGTRKYEIVENPQESLSIYCNRCQTHTSHKTIVKASVTTAYDDRPISFFEKYRIVECAGCHSVRFVERAICSEDEDYYDPTPFVEARSRIYPISEDGPLSGRRFEFIYTLPDDVRKIYDETLAAVKNKLFILAGVGMRAVLDAVCRDQRIGRGTMSLEKRLKIMFQEKGLITASELEILKKIKDFGNQSAHEGKSLKPYEFSSVLIVINHLLDKLYLLPEIKKEFEDNENKQKVSFVDEVFDEPREDKVE